MVLVAACHAPTCRSDAPGQALRTCRSTSLASLRYIELAIKTMFAIKLYPRLHIPGGWTSRRVPSQGNTITSSLTRRLLLSVPALPVRHHQHNLQPLPLLASSAAHTEPP